MSKRTSVILDDAIEGFVEGLSLASKSTDDLPPISQSQVIRLALHNLASDILEDDADLGGWGDAYEIDASDLREILPEHEIIKFRRDQFKDGEGYVRNLRTGFEARVRDHFKNRFKSGIKEDELDKWAQNMKIDARLLYPPDLGEPDEDPHQDRREECLQYVEDLVVATKRAIQESDYDPLDPASIYEQYEGVERGRERSRVEEHQSEIVRDIADRLDRLRGRSDRDAIVRALAKEHGVAPHLIETLIDEMMQSDKPIDQIVAQQPTEIALSDGGELDE